MFKKTVKLIFGGDLFNPCNQLAQTRIRRQLYVLASLRSASPSGCIHSNHENFVMHSRQKRTIILSSCNYIIITKICYVFKTNGSFYCCLHTPCSPPSPKTFGVITCKLCSLLAKSPVIVTCVAYPSPLCLSTTNTHHFHVPSPFVPLPDLL